MTAAQPRSQWVDGARHHLGLDLGAELRSARRAAGLGLRAAARRIGTTHGYLSQLERGQRCPSAVMAEQLVDALRLQPELAAELRAIAVADAGRSSPWNEAG